MQADMSEGVRFRNAFLVSSLCSPSRAAFLTGRYKRNFAVPTILAVRTENAKLIRYPGHDDWTELYDLRADPYETKNLANDSTKTKLLKQMETEFDRQTRAVKYRIPETAHRAPTNAENER